MRLPLFVFALACCLLGERLAGAQAAATPFETLTVGLAYAEPVASNALDAGWRTLGSVDAHLSAPFYLGTVRAGGHYQPYSRRRFDVPSLDALLLYLEWTATVRLPAGFRAAAGARMGFFVMRFSEADLAPNARTEQELAGYLTAGLVRPLAGPVSVRASLAYGTIALSEPIRHAYGAVGLQYTFRTPRRLREALQ